MGVTVFYLAGDDKGGTARRSEAVHNGVNTRQAIAEVGFCRFLIYVGPGVVVYVDRCLVRLVAIRAADLVVASRLVL